MEKKYIAAGLVILAITLALWAGLGKQGEEQQQHWTSEQYNCTKWYDNTTCIDKNSIYYGCDIKKQFCSEDYVRKWEENTYVCRQVISK